MADFIELVTWPNTENIFHEVSSNGITFAIKSEGLATLGLAKKPGTNLDVRIDIHNYSSIKMKNGNVTRVPTFNILSDITYAYFWLSWDSDSIKLGRTGRLRPIVHHSTGIEGIKYVTFGVPDLRAPVYWQIDLPPTISQPKLKPVEGGKVQWIQCDSQLPDGVVIGGFEASEPLYIIRAFHRQSLTPGKFVPSLGLGFISWAGEAHEKSEFEALCGYDFTWVKTSDVQLPQGAVVGGYSEVNDEALYIGRANINGNIIPGKVQLTHKVCYFSYMGREHAASNYEVLVAGTDNQILPRYRLNRHNYEIHNYPHLDHDHESDEHNEEHLGHYAAF